MERSFSLSYNEILYKTGSFQCFKHFKRTAMTVFIAWLFLSPPTLWTPCIVLLKDLHLVCSLLRGSIPYYTNSYSFSKFHLKAPTKLGEYSGRNYFTTPWTVSEPQLPNFSMNDKIMNTINLAEICSLLALFLITCHQFLLLTFTFKICEEHKSTAFKQHLSWVSKLKN